MGHKNDHLRGIFPKLFYDGLLPGGQVRSFSLVEEAISPSAPIVFRTCKVSPQSLTGPTLSSPDRWLLQPHVMGPVKVPHSSEVIQPSFHVDAPSRGELSLLFS